MQGERGGRRGVSGRGVSGRGEGTGGTGAKERVNGTNGTNGREGKRTEGAERTEGTVRERMKEFAREGALPEGAWWLSPREIAAALRVTRQHVIHLIQEGAFDCAIDLRGPEARQAYWRVWRASFVRFGQRARGEVCGRFDLEAELAGALAGKASALTGQEMAAHFRCSKQHIYNLAGELPNVGLLEAAGRSLVRAPKGELMALIRKRMV